MPLLVCESVQGHDVRSLLRARDAAILPDLVELRLDSVRDLHAVDVAGLLADRRLPVVVTCRPRWEGGGFDGDEETRRGLLEAALRAGAEFVDVEWAAPWRAGFLDRWRERTVLSFHDFAKTPADLVGQLGEMLRARSAVTKVAVQSNSLRDLAPLLALRRTLPRDRQVIVIGMGLAGMATRLVPWRFGSAWTYGGNAVAPGQVPVEQLVHEFRVRAGGPATGVFGIAGRPVAHSLSPAIHNSAFSDLAMDAVFLPLAAADFDDFLWVADALDVVGASVTAPFKREALRAANRSDRLAQQVGAANTLRRDADGGWSAINSDVEGFLRPLSDVPLEGRRASILGAGGAARAVAVALAGRGATVTIHARHADRGRVTAESVGCAHGPWPPAPGSWDLLVNATPVGTWPDDDQIPVEVPFVHGGVVYDLVYNPPRTALLRAAEAAGCRTIGGLEMLVGQASRQFEWWTGRPASLEAMRAAAAGRLEQSRTGRSNGARRETGAGANA